MTLTECRWCGNTHGPLCPNVKAIEYHPDGTVKRVEFKTVADFVVPYVAPAMGLPPVSHPSPMAPYRISDGWAMTWA